jgi:DNA-binding response OmpR family regulator
VAWIDQHGSGIFQMEGLESSAKLPKPAWGGSMRFDIHSSPHARFGEFELDVRTGELRRNGDKLSLQEKPFQVLMALLER